MTCTSDTSYTVQAGDTLYLIAERLLGDGNRWTEIKNPDGSSPIPTQLQIGQELVLPSSEGSPSSPEGSLPPSRGIAQEALDAHNRYRSEVGVPPLQWSDSLAASAQQWADHLAATGSFEHSGTQGQGENLWKGTANAFSLTQMVDRWGAEKQYFKNGAFPDVSTTGNWGDVGHYTQIVWKDTSQVGCASADGSDGNSYLVCRYVSPGNFQGQAAF